MNSEEHYVGPAMALAISENYRQMLRQMAGRLPTNDWFEQPIVNGNMTRYPLTEKGKEAFSGRLVEHKPRDK